MSLIANKHIKEYEIFNLLGDKCTAEEYSEKFKELYPDDLKIMYNSFGNNRERGKSIEYCIENYLHNSFKTGRKRYRKSKGIKYPVPEKKSKEQTEYRSYLIENNDLLYKICDARLLDKIDGVAPDKNNPGKYLWFFQKDDRIKQLIQEHNREIVNKRIENGN